VCVEIVNNKNKPVRNTIKTIICVYTDVCICGETEKDIQIDMNRHRSISVSVYLSVIPRSDI
jgi:hypothetical protein